MEQAYNGCLKQCATCAFWLGARTCDALGWRVLVASSGAEARCGNPNGRLKGHQRLPSGVCNDYQKWPILK